MADCTTGRHDVDNIGLTPTDFQQLAAAWLSLVPPTTKMLLTLDEVLGVGFYAFAAYKPLNGWLRTVLQVDVGMLRGIMGFNWEDQANQHSGR